jgi:S1 RNA binding domain protein
MPIEVGSIIDGVVSGITNFGAFVDLPENKVGLVHISEVSNIYVRDVRDFLKEKDNVKVKVLSVDQRGKIALSIKQAAPREMRPPREERPLPPRPAARFSSRQVAPATFEDKISRFLKDSDDRLTTLKKNTESKRGGRGSSRRGG